MVAVAVDAYDQLFLLAFLIIEGKNNDSWGWFMACVQAKVTQQEELCVISDRHREIVDVINDEYLGSGGWAGASLILCSSPG